MNFHILHIKENEIFEKRAAIQAMSFMVVSALLVSLWIYFDYIFEKKYLYPFMILRLTYTTSTLLLVAVLYKKPLLIKYHRIYGFFTYCFLVITIFPMVLLADHFYPYLMGFSIVFYTISITLLWPMIYTAIPILCIFPVLAVFNQLYPENNVDLFTFVFMLITILAVSMTASYLSYHSAINLSNLTMELKELSSLDGLTRIFNRRHFDERLTSEWFRSFRSKAPLSLIMCDIDFFKMYNDTYGHQLGDVVLKTVAQSIKKSIRRDIDFLARYGGEEFVVILPSTDIEGAVKVAEMLVKNVKELKIETHNTGIEHCVTISAGVAAIFPGHKHKPSDLIEAADKALYRAKHNGRDRVEVEHTIKNE